jgi:dipeptidyl aminopeptidase/acylaminoacyl peptidase
LLLCIGLLLTCGLIGCREPFSPEMPTFIPPTLTYTPVPPTDTPWPTVTFTPVAVATRRPPTYTPTPTVTNTPVPTNPRPVTPTPTPPPEFSGKLVFQLSSGGDIYVINADGSGLRPLTHGLDPALSPDGKQVAFTRWEFPYGIYVINADGTGERQLFGKEQTKSPTWSPDGRLIAFSFRRLARRDEGDPDELGDLEHGEWRLGVVEVETGYFGELPTYLGSSSPTWGPQWTGPAIIYGGAKGLGIVTLEGPYRYLTDHPGHCTPAWSPDGKRVAYVIRYPDRGELWAMNPDGSSQVPLTAPPVGARRPISSVAPAWSPDSRHIVFLSNRNGPWEIFVMKADGSEQRKMFATALDHLSFSYEFASERVVAWGP